MTGDEIIKKAICTYGPEHQIDIAVEEMSELTKELIKWKRYRNNKRNIAEEIADVEITLAELKVIFNASDQVQKFVEMKMERLEQRIEKEIQRNGSAKSEENKEGNGQTGEKPVRNSNE